MKKLVKIAISKLLLLIPDKLNQIREFALNMLLEANGSKGRVTYKVAIKNPNNIYIGKKSYVNGGMLAASENARIQIGDNCMISYNVHMRTDSHVHLRTDMPMNQQGMSEADIVVGDDVWIGYGAQIMSGVRIGSHSIVGAGALVTHDIPDYSVAVGVPARVIRDRRGD